MPQYQFPGLPNWEGLKKISFLSEKEGSELFYSYVETLCWTEEGPDNENPYPLIPAKHFRRDSWRELVSRLAEDLETLPEEFREMCAENPRMFGHELLLSRNGHGSGFFDSNTFPEEARDALQDWARELGEVGVVGPENPRRKCWIFVEWSQAKREEYRKNHG